MSSKARGITLVLEHKNKNKLHSAELLSLEGCFHSHAEWCSSLWFLNIALSRAL